MQTLWLEFWDQLPGAMELLAYAYGLFLVTWPFFLILERVSPVTRTTEYAFNWKVVFSNIVLTPLFYAFVLALTSILARGLGLPALTYPAFEWSSGVVALDLVWRSVLLFVTACFLSDFWYYWWHRAQHEWPWLWELHKLHHSDEHLNSTSIYRSHFLELAGQALIRGLTVGLLIDLSSAPQTAIGIVFVGLSPAVWDFFIHANVRFDWLNRLVPFFSTPQFHWVHHSKLPEHQDKNYAIWLPLFDVLFGTYIRPRVDEYPPTGLSSGEKINTLWEAQAGPFLAWSGSARTRKAE